jgi:hypothetical protein
METEELGQELTERVIGLIRQGDQVAAVRVVREETSLSLAEAKRVVDELRDADPPKGAVLEAPAVSGGGSAEQQAAAVLAAVEEARAAGFTPIPGWFFPAVGALIGGVMALQAIDPPALGLAAIVVLAAGYVAVEKASARRVDRNGAAPRALTLRQQLVLVGPLVALWIAGEILDRDGGWVWLVVAGVSAAWTIGYGVLHNRRARG